MMMSYDFAQTAQAARDAEAGTRAPNGREKGAAMATAAESVREPKQPAGAPVTIQSGSGHPFPF
jgi:hypothetical protein